MEVQSTNPQSVPVHRMHPLVCQRWVESDEGFPRPWGFTVHLSEADCESFRQEFWRKQRAELGEAVPSSYVREDGESFMVPASAAVVGVVERLAKRGIRGAWGIGEDAPRSGVEEVAMPELPQEDEDVQTMARRFEVLRRPLVVAACASAAADFDSYLRKVPRGSNLEPKPFFSHLQAVAMLLAECGYDEHVVAAGYLHDHLEDLPKLWTQKKMAARFGDRVADLVGWVTHQPGTKSWHKRSDLYRQHLEDAPPEARAISAADKISNIEDTLVSLRAGYPVRTLLRTGWKDNSEKFHALLELFEGEVHHKLVERLTQALAEFDRLGPALEKKH